MSLRYAKSAITLQKSVSVGWETRSKKKKRKVMVKRDLEKKGRRKVLKKREKMIPRKKAKKRRRRNVNTRKRRKLLRLNGSRIHMVKRGSLSPQKSFYQDILFWIFALAKIPLRKSLP